MDITSSTANWPVTQGDLRSCLSVESPLCPLDENFSISAPLVLQRPVTDDPNSAPCEITIVFPRRHEIRQIYVRSTARIYEVYYAPNSTSSNEYLCTVRCSLVERSIQDGNDSEGFKETESRFAGETSSRSSNTSTSEDSWVDVKKSLDSNISKVNVSPPRNMEDLYEATAEISDAEPCISLTLRLLSIQSKGYVCVDEIYVFGDPVDDDTEDQKNPEGSTAGNSLMALLAPTLLQLQLSRSGIGRTMDNSDRKQPTDQNSHTIGSQGVDLITATHANIPEISSSVSSQLAATYHAGSAPASATEPKKSHASARIPDEAVNHNFTTKDDPSRVEKALNELISRVIKIEDTCSRFEENMRKPICSIEERLSRVEQQLSVLTKNSQVPKISSGTRFSAPDWSCVESASNSSDVDESNPICGTENTDDIPSIPVPAQPEGIGSSVSMDTTEVLSSPMSTAPQYVIHETEDTDPPILVKDTYLEQPKKTVSIDDALASALAAFMSPAHPQTLTKAFSIKAPEYSTSEEGENSDLHSSVRHNPQITSSIIHADETETTGCEESSTSISNNVVLEVQELHDNDTSSYQVEEHKKGSSYGNVEGISQCTNGEEPQGEEHIESSSSDDFEGSVQYLNDEDAHDIHKIVSNRDADDSANIEHIYEEDTNSSGSISLILENEVGDHQQKAKNERQATNQDALLQVIELARMPSQVNFDTSILDVMFVSGEISSTNSSLEALLRDTTSSHQVEAPRDAEVGSEGDSTTANPDLISVEQETNSLASVDFCLDMHHYDLGITSMTMENTLNVNEAVDDIPSHLSHEVFPASLI